MLDLVPRSTITVIKSNYMLLHFEFARNISLLEIYHSNKSFICLSKFVPCNSGLVS